MTRPTSRALPRWCARTRVCVRAYTLASLPFRT